MKRAGRGCVGAWGHWGTGAVWEQPGAAGRVTTDGAEGSVARMRCWRAHGGGGEDRVEGAGLEEQGWKSRAGGAGLEEQGNGAWPGLHGCGRKGE